MISCGKCGATADPDSTTRDRLPPGWERFIVKGERRYVCTVCRGPAVLVLDVDLGGPKPPRRVRPAALVLADHQTRPHPWTPHGAGIQVTCRCNDWAGWDYDHPAHQADMLADAGLLKEDT